MKLLKESTLSFRMAGSILLIYLSYSLSKAIINIISTF